MNRWEKDIDHMMRAFGQTTRSMPDEPPVSAKEMELRKLLLAEESQELLEAIDEGHLPSIAKEIADVLVVTIGVARCFGIDMEPVWNAVHVSNMAKLSGGTHPETGKRLKPPGWKKPDMERELLEQGWLWTEGGYSRNDPSEE